MNQNPEQIAHDTIDKQLLLSEWIIQVVEPIFFKYFTETQKTRKYIDNMVSSAEQNTITQTTLCNIEVLLPTIGMQKQIVQEIECRLSVCDKMEETIKTSLQQAETLRQSILKRAFEEKLVDYMKRVLETN